MRLSKHFPACAIILTGLLICSFDFREPEPSYEKFPLKISPNGRHISDNQGTPFLMVADVAWQMLRRLSYADAVHYMDVRKSQSFNTFLVQLLPASPGQRNFNKALPFLENNDLSKPNALYFDYLEKIIIAARERQLAVGIVVTRKSWDTFFDAHENSWENYGAYVGKRFAKHANIIYIISEEEYPNTAQFNAVSDGIRQNSDNQIIAALSVSSPAAPREGSAKNRSDLRFIIPDSTVTASEYAAVANWQKNAAEASSQPFLIANSEFPKEITDQSELIRNQAYQSIMSSAAGFCHMSTIKNFHNTWKVNITRDGAEYIQNFVKIMKGIPWEYMQPDTLEDLLPDSLDKHDIGVVSMSNKRMCMMYIPSSRAVRLNLNYMNGTHFGTVWYSPRTGKRWVGEEFKALDEATVHPPDAQTSWDWILLIGTKN